MNLLKAKTTQRLRRLLGKMPGRFQGSADYWEHRYLAGGTSGSGSYGENARVKADIVNLVIERHGIGSVIEFGCGDGNQLSLLSPPRYVGLDVSGTAIRRARNVFRDDFTKSFFLYSPAHFFDQARVLSADLALSQEVIFHLVEDNIFDLYMSHLFDAAQRFVLICSSDRDLPLGRYERHRRFTPWVDENRADWHLVEFIKNPRPYDPGTGNGMLADFFLYSRDPGLPTVTVPLP